MARRGVKGVIRGAGLRLQGDKQLIRALNTLSIRIQSRVTKAAVRAAAKPIISAASAAAPEWEGSLASSIGQKVKRYRRGAEATISVIGARKGFGMQAGGFFRNQWSDPRYYAHLVEKGTRPHLLPWLLMGGNLRKQWWRHPGAKPKPFLGPAFDAFKITALATMKRILWRGIERWTKKLA